MVRLVSPPEAKRRVTQQDEPRERGDTLTIRVPVDIREQLEAMKARGYGTSAALFLMCRSYMEARGEIGPEAWHGAVELASEEQRVGVGVILGRLAKSTLDAQQKKR